jgi:hypothetical protein
MSKLFKLIVTITILFSLLNSGVLTNLKLTIGIEAKTKENSISKIHLNKEKIVTELYS